LQSDISAYKKDATELATQTENKLRRGLNFSWPPLAYLLMSMALTWPLPLQLSRAIPRGQPDSWQNIWNFWWLRTALFERGVNPYQTDLLFYPYRDSRNPLGLYYHTLQPALSLPSSLLTYLLATP